MARKRSSKTWVSLIPGKRTPFRRALRDKGGKVVEVYRFEPESPLELEADAMELVRRDIGRALCVCRTTEQEGRFRIDWKRTNEIHTKCYGTEIPRHASKSINVGASSEPSRVIEGPRDPRPESNDDGEESADGEDIVLSDELMALLEKNADRFDELSPSGVVAFLQAGNKLEDLEGFDPAKATELKESLGIE